MTPTLRLATPDDAPQMCDLINRIIEIGGSTAHRRPFDAARMTDHYIRPPGLICCTLAERDDLVMGFQVLVWPSTGPGYDACPPGMSFIGSFARHGHSGQGIGRAMFEKTLTHARAAGVKTIDATIWDRNTSGLAYYTALGFVDYGEKTGSDSLGAPMRQLRKRFDL